MTPSPIVRQPNQTKTTRPGGAQTAERIVAIDYLRSFVIVLVVFHHAALAYTSFSTFNPRNYTQSTAPIVDPNRWPLLDLPVVLNDTFFMPLMFLLSGLFTLSSLDRKGSARFFAERLKRLGIPFLVGSVSIVPLAYLPSWLLATPPDPSAYWLTFFTSDAWPSGPMWFLWMLLAFAGVVALIHRHLPSLAARIRYRPSIGGTIALTVFAYLSLRLFVPPYHWASLGGPLDFQAARVGLYFSYFVLGAALGASPAWQTATWPKQWGALLGLGLLAFTAFALLSRSPSFPSPGLTADLLSGVAFAAACSCLCLGLLGAFRRFVRNRTVILDSLTDNAYGIYITHYVFITWLQFLLLPTSWPAWARFFIVFGAGLGLSWGATMLLRRIPSVRRVL